MNPTVETLLQINEFHNASSINGIHRDVLLMLNHLMMKPYSTISTSPLGINLCDYLMEYPRPEIIAHLQFKIYREFTSTYGHLNIESVNLFKSKTKKGGYDLLIDVTPINDLIPDEYTHDGRRITKYQVRVNLEATSTDFKIEDTVISIVH